MISMFGRGCIAQAGRLRVVFAHRPRGGLRGVCTSQRSSYRVTGLHSKGQCTWQGLGRALGSANWLESQLIARSLTTASKSKPVDMSVNKVPLVPEREVEVAFASTTPSEWSGDLLVLGVFEEEVPAEGKELEGELKTLDTTLNGAVTDILSTYEFKAKLGTSQTVRTGAAAKSLCLTGLGKASEAALEAKWGLSAFTTLGTSAAAASKAVKASTVAVALPGLPDSIPASAAAGKTSLGLLHGIYETTRFKSTDATPKLASATLLFGSEGEEAAAQLARARAFVAGTTLTRYLVEAPPNVCTPSHLARAAAEIQAAAPDVVELKVLEQSDCEKEGMGLYLGVTRASAEPPKFIHLVYQAPGEGPKRRLAIVGKGVTFDSGGYNVKAGVGSMIEVMKIDMGGAGAVLGAARTLSLLRPEGVEVHFCIAACENMISGTGYHPGDILVASNGKTVEIANTDAEGRLTLADALLYVQKYGKPQAIVDIATLTGACMIALGSQIAGIFSNTDEAAAEYLAAARAAGEKAWRLPLEPAYADQLKSPIADYKNVGSRAGGSITAAMFLQEFVDTSKGTSWVHVDAAAPVFSEKDISATGYGARTLAEWVLAQAQKQE